MTIAANTDWEIRTTGASTNGAGFKDLNPGTSVDYSQQDAAQLALSDVVVSTTAVSSATGGFTAAMEGNCIFLLGSGVTTGWYQITGYTDTNNITIDRTAGSGSGITGNVGGAYLFDSVYNNTFFASQNKGNYAHCHVKAGTYSGSWGIAANSIVAIYMRMEGYQTTRGDTPTGTNRPLLDTGNNASYIYWSSSYGQMLNMRVDSTYSVSTTSTVYASGAMFVQRNCKITRSGFSGAVAMRSSGDWQRLFQSEYICTTGTAVQVEDEGCCLEWCNIHDSTNGVYYSTSGEEGTTIENCIIDTCSGTGVRFRVGGRMQNTTVYNCGTGVYFLSSYGVCVNNIIHTCTTGINGVEHVYSDNNTLYNNSTDRTGGVVAGPNDVGTNPLLTDPANQDFTLASGSPAFDAGIKLGTVVGLP